MIELHLKGIIWRNHWTRGELWSVVSLFDDGGGRKRGRKKNCRQSRKLLTNFRPKRQNSPKWNFSPPRHLLMIPNTTTRDIAPPPRKRARKANISPDTEPCIPNHELAEPVRSQQYDTLPPFLALPRELRDEIYKHVLEQDESSTLKTGRGNNIVTRCGLVGVNNQISEEFLDAVLFHAHVITATVRNHNFAHVVTFLNRLSQAQLARLSAHGPAADEVDDDKKPKRKIRIILYYC